jgi:anti-sigma factor RsiW
MKHRQVIKRFIDWYDKRTGERENLEIERHLEACDDCRRYFDKMTKLMEGVGPVSLPNLASDPFLPARIRASSAGGAVRKAAPGLVFGRLATAVMGVSVLVAAVAGIVMGSGLSSRARAGEQTNALVEAYYEAFSQDQVVPDWDAVLETQSEDES